MSPAEIRLSIENMRDSCMRQAEAAALAFAAINQRAEDQQLSAETRRMAAEFGRQYVTREQRCLRKAEALAGALEFVPQFEKAE